jgi:hypothetical protein
MQMNPATLILFRTEIFFIANPWSLVYENVQKRNSVLQIISISNKWQPNKAKKVAYSSGSSARLAYKTIRGIQSLTNLVKGAVI